MTVYQFEKKLYDMVTGLNIVLLNYEQNVLLAFGCFSFRLFHNFSLHESSQPFEVLKILVFQTEESHIGFQDNSWFI